MKKLIYMLTIIAVMSSCILTKNQRQANRVVKKIEKLKAKYPLAFDSVTTVKIDTLIVEREVKGDTEIKFDTVSIDNILTKYITNIKEVPVIREKLIRNIISEGLVDTVSIDTAGVRLKIYQSGKKLEYAVVIDSIYIKKEAEKLNITKSVVVRKRFYQDWLFWLIASLAVALYIFKEAVIAYIGRVTARI